MATRPALKISAPKIAIERGPGFAMSLPERAGALSERMQDIARNYLGARQKSGAALLEACRWLSEAREEAKYGEWGIFLEATGTSEDQATSLIAVHSQAMTSPLFADAVRRNFLSLSAAYELISAPAETQDRLLKKEQPIARRQIRDEKQAAKLRAGAEFESPPPEQRGPGQPAPDPWPDAPDGWRWNRRGRPAHLVGPDGWQTHDYDYPERALAEAQRRILSQPKAEREAGAARSAYEAAERADQALITEANAAGHTPDPTLIQVASWQAQQPQSAVARTDELQVAHWYGPTRGRLTTTTELIKWCAEHAGDLDRERCELLAEDMNQMIVALEHAIEVLT